MKTRRLVLFEDIQSNPKTCGDCFNLSRLDSGTGQDEWWCKLFAESRGYVGHMKTPNRSSECLKAEALANQLEGET